MFFDRIWNKEKKSIQPYCKEIIALRDGIDNNNVRNIK